MYPNYLARWLADTLNSARYPYGCSWGGGIHTQSNKGGREAAKGFWEKVEIRISLQHGLRSSQ